MEKRTGYDIKQAIVFGNENIKKDGKILYCPIYLAGLLEHQVMEDDLIYTLDLSGLQEYIGGD